MGMELGGGGWHDGKLSASTPFHLVPGTEMLEGGTLFVEKESQDPGFWFPGPPYCKWPGFLTDSKLFHRRFLGLGVKET